MSSSGTGSSSSMSSSLTGVVWSLIA